MNGLRFGLRGLLGIAAAAMLAACAGTKPADEEAGVQAQAPVTQDEQLAEPGIITTPEVGREGLDDPYGRATQESLENYAGDRIFFGFDSAELSPLARQTLQRQAEWLKAHENVDATIEGHADERGTREYNLALSERRANSAKNYLVALGVSPNRLNTISYGKERPAVLGSGEEVWRQNRRAVLNVSRPGA